jgi:hypothetical protein
MKADITSFVPGGVKWGDAWHWGETYGGTCSRCDKLISNHEIPLMLFKGVNAMLVYCSDCTGGPVPLQPESSEWPATRPEAAPVVCLLGDGGQ